MGSAGRAAPAFREVKFETGRRIVSVASTEGTRALFLLGDTFDSDRVGEEDIRRTVSILARADCPVYVLPGNHDWWHRGGVLYAFREQAKAHANIRVLLVEEPFQVDGIAGATFFPCPVMRHAGLEDPTAWIPPRRPEDGLRVGLVHGALDLANWGGRVPARVAEVRDLDLALVGDWHAPHEGPSGRTHYPGSPEPGGFDESHGGQVLVVSLDDEVRVRRVPVGQLSWRTIDADLSRRHCMAGSASRT